MISFVRLGKSILFFAHVSTKFVSISIFIKVGGEEGLNKLQYIEYYERG